MVVHNCVQIRRMAHSVDAKKATRFTVTENYVLVCILLFIGTVPLVSQLSRILNFLFGLGISTLQVSNGSFVKLFYKTPFFCTVDQGLISIHQN